MTPMRRRARSPKCTNSSPRNSQNSVDLLSHSARLKHRHANPEIDEQAAEYAVDPYHHTLRVPDPGGGLRGDGRDAEAPKRAARDEDQAERQEGERLVRRIGGDKLRQERQEKQRHFRI